MQGAKGVWTLADCFQHVVCLYTYLKAGSVTIKVNKSFSWKCCCEYAAAFSVNSLLYQTPNCFISVVHILPKQIYNFTHDSRDINLSYSQYKDHTCISQPNILFSLAPGLDKGPAESLWGPHREGDEEIHQTDPPRSLLPAQQHDCTQRHQR